MKRAIESIYCSFIPPKLRYRIDKWRLQDHHDKLRTSEITEYSLRPFDRHKCIFIHIPRTGGVSISRSLFGNLAGGHRDVQRYEMIFGKQTFSTYFKFTVTRNPWDRLLSAFMFLKKGGMCEEDRLWGRKHLEIYTDFESFVLGWLNAKNIHKQVHFMPQHKFVCDNDLTQRVDFVGRFENIAHDFEYIKEKLGISSELQHLNKSKRRDYCHYYSRKMQDIVTDLYYEDINLFGYEFGD